MPLPLRFAATACALACLLHAGGPAAWESNSWADFVKGRFSGISLTRDGRLALKTEEHRAAVHTLNADRVPPLVFVVQA